MTKAQKNLLLLIASGWKLYVGPERTATLAKREHELPIGYDAVVSPLVVRGHLMLMAAGTDFDLWSLSEMGLAYVRQLQGADGKR